jgi:triosephosphate isomerase
VCPAFPHLHAVALALLGSRVAVVAQDCHAAGRGAHTGDVSAAMLRDAGATHVILGHSERRADHGENDAAVLAKAEAALAAGLVPHHLRRRNGGGAAGRHGRAGGGAPAQRQRPLRLRDRGRRGGLRAGLGDRHRAHADGGGHRGHPRHDAPRAGGALRRGGAGNAAALRRLGQAGNAAAIMALPDVDGALVGGASLVPADFLAIAAAVPG